MVPGALHSIYKYGLQPTSSPCVPCSTGSTSESAAVSSQTMQQKQLVSVVLFPGTLGASNRAKRHLARDCCSPLAQATRVNLRRQCCARLYPARHGCLARIRRMMGSKERLRWED